VPRPDPGEGLWQGLQGREGGGLRRVDQGVLGPLDQHQLDPDPIDARRGLRRPDPCAGRLDQGVPRPLALGRVEGPEREGAEEGGRGLGRQVRARRLCEAEVGEVRPAITKKEDETKRAAFSFRLPFSLLFEGGEGGRGAEAGRKEEGKRAEENEENIAPLRKLKKLKYSKKLNTLQNVQALLHQRGRPPGPPCRQRRRALPGEQSREAARGIGRRRGPLEQGAVKNSFFFLVPFSVCFHDDSVHVKGIKTYEQPLSFSERAPAGLIGANETLLGNGKKRGRPLGLMSREFFFSLFFHFSSLLL